MTSGREAIANALSIVSSGVTHTGHPGPCTSITPGTTHRCRSDHRVRLAAADFHDDPRTSHRGADRGGQASDGIGVSVFVEELQGIRD